MKTVCSEDQQRKDTVDAKGSCKKQWRWEKDQSRHWDPGVDKLSWETKHTIGESQKSKIFPRNACFGDVVYLVGYISIYRFEYSSNSTPNIQYM